MITDHVQPDRRIDDVLMFLPPASQSAGSAHHQPIIRPSAARVPIFNTLGFSPQLEPGISKSLSESLIGKLSPDVRPYMVLGHPRPSSPPPRRK